MWRQVAHVHARDFMRAGFVGHLQLLGIVDLLQEPSDCSEEVRRDIDSKNLGKRSHFAPALSQDDHVQIE